MSESADVKDCPVDVDGQSVITLRAWVFADIHSPDHFRAPPINPEQCDLVITLGDISDTSIDHILTRAGSLPMIGVPGNHDGVVVPGIIDVHRKVIDFNGIRIGGFGGARKYKEDHPNHYTDFHVQRKMLTMPAVDLFLSHAPPACTTPSEGRIHRGFEAFDRYLHKRRPQHWLHGHIYRRYRQQVGATQIISVQERQFVTLTFRRDR